MNPEDDRAQHDLAFLLQGGCGHDDLDIILAELPSADRGRRLPGFPHTAWQLLDHVQRVQHDILEWCRDPAHRYCQAPEAYWSADGSPRSAEAWDHSLREYREDRLGLLALVAGAAGLGQPIGEQGERTLLYGVILAIAHTSYHCGQLRMLCKLL